MKFGMCTSTFSKDNLNYLKNIGYDYVEASFKRFAALCDEEFAATLATVKDVGLPVIAANSMLPSIYKIAADDFDMGAALEYLNTGFGRASQLGIQKVVFGSGGARSTPKGIDKEEGNKRVVNFLKKAGGIAKVYKITIVIEPLSPFECNLINTVAQSAQLAVDCGIDNIHAHADFFHMKHSRDSVNNINLLKGRVLHSHISNPTTRMFPKSSREANYSAYLKVLIGIGCETCSVEGLAIFFKAAAQKSIKLLMDITKIGSN